MVRNVVLIAAALALVAPVPGRGGLYWHHSVRGKVVSACFVGDASTRVLTAWRRSSATSRTSLQRPTSASTTWVPVLRRCPSPAAPTRFDGDIRIVIPNISVSGTGPVPGQGCPMFGGAGNYNGDNDGWGSWSNAPDDLIPHRSCLYNLKLGDDAGSAGPYLNGFESGNTSAWSSVAGSAPRRSGSD